MRYGWFGNEVQNEVTGQRSRPRPTYLWSKRRLPSICLLDVMCDETELYLWLIDTQTLTAAAFALQFT